MLLSCGIVAARGAESYRRNDFWCLRTAGQLVLERRDPYDERTRAATAGAPIALPSGGVAPSACTGAVFAYPLWTALGMVPFAMLPPGASATLWIAISVAAVAWGALAIGASAGPRGHRPLIIGAVLVASVLPWIAYAVSSARVSETYAAVVSALSALLREFALRVRGSTGSTT